MKNLVIVPEKVLPRKGFSLVELMIAMAIIILMLSIMSQAFVIATTVMQGLKDAAEMQLLARPVMNILQRDLSANHFEGSKKLSDPDFWDFGPPRQGYFMAWQEYPHDVDESALGNYSAINGTYSYNSLNYNIHVAPVIKTLAANIFTGNHPGYEGKTSDSVQYRRSGGVANHQLAFTVKLSGKNPEDFFQASYPFYNIAPLNANNLFYPSLTNNPTQGMYDANIKRFETDPNLIHSQWAEVAYFIGPYGPNTGIVPGTSPSNTNGLAKPLPTGYTGGTNSLPLYTLYRQQRLLLPDMSALSNYTEPTVAAPYQSTRPPIRITIPTPLEYDALKKSTIEYSFRPNFANTGTPTPPTTMHFNTTRDLTVPWKRAGFRDLGHLGFPYHKTDNTTYPLFPEFTNLTTNSLENTDVLATNVISFDVRFLTDDRMEFEDLFTVFNQYDPITNSQPYKNHQAYWNYPSNITSNNSLPAGGNPLLNTSAFL